MKMLGIVRSLLALFLSCAPYIACLPSIGNEYVHIKLHVPKEIHHAHIHHIIPEEKVIQHHHHHRRTRPIKNSSNRLNHKALLQSLVHSQINQPISSEHLRYLSHGEDLANHIIKPVETYIIEEEEKKVPSHKHKITTPHNHYSAGGHYHESEESASGSYKNYHAAASKETFYHSHYAARKPHVENNDNQHIEAVIAAGDYNYKPKPHLKTVKIAQPNYDLRPHTDTIEETQIPADEVNSYHISAHYNNQQNQHHQAQTQSYYHQQQQQEDYSEQASPSQGYHYDRPQYENSADAHADSEQYYDNEDIFLLPPKVVNAHTSAPAHPHQPRFRHPANVKQNTLYNDELTSQIGYDSDYPLSASSSKPFGEEQSSVVANGQNIDWPEPDNKYIAAETYMGVDSYTATHVQGLGSGGYKYPTPYP